MLLCLLLGRTPQRFFAELKKQPETLTNTWAGTEAGLVIGAIVVYMEQVGGVPQEDTIMALQDLLNLSPAEEVMYAHEIRSRRAEQRGWDNGLREGTLKGKLEGKLEGKLDLVAKLLTQRFGPLPANVVARMQTATQEELEEMGLRILSASTLDEVLGKPKRKRR